MYALIARAALAAFITVLALGLTRPAQAQTFQEVWSAAITYATNDLVTARGSTWRSVHNSNVGKVPGSTNPSTAADWVVFSAGLNPAGAWSDTITYHNSDIVTHQFATWRAKRTNINR